MVMGVALYPFSALVGLLPWLLLAILAPWNVLLAEELKPTRWPLFSQKPVLLAWNAPTEDCGPRHGVYFPLEQFQIVASPNEGFVRQNLTIFYKDRLGLYPYYNVDGIPVNGGLPQAASLTEHHEKMPEGVQKYIRETGAKGLAVIDWEEWRPMWIRNWDVKDVYRNRSRQLVAQKNPDWLPEQVGRVGQQEFELSARRFMLETLRLAKSLRPNQLWGFYLFPDCYNHDYRSGLQNYTGRCPDVEMGRNDQLTWLWTESTALFPSVYLSTMLRSTTFGRQFVRNRVKEGMRLASVGDGLARPVFVYTRPTYSNEPTQLSETDLVSTIGESVALGAAGVIFWGDSTYTKSRASCSSLNEYLGGPLGRYLLNVSTAAGLCSQKLCGYHGRCLRKHSDSDVYLHLNPSSHTISSKGSSLRVTGQLGPEELALYRTHFQCQCYSGYRGEGCVQKEQGQNGASPILTVWSLTLIIPLGLLTLLH
ncbi:hyaluronidase-2-like [Hypomesus transpacificus]|uniref:hyaluronidase-2-like n=1 Tax=Hypomesus transpacificus TaxID=137520 RepID=UPI001F0887A1|nr:hyaluronidase-2-like [Hypomesus transpacificus]XP_046882280.1 hyaluronidase-2-like [Hypomesus transpacificus]XP_046882281.1 hyaluronidase-2-like [Hypomesus transpacificus]